MNILIVSAHPAQVHGFKLVREELMKAGHKVFWATTDKDIAINLLQQLGIEYFLIFRLIPYLRRNKIDMVVDRYEPFISVAAWLNRTPHICLADTEHAAIKCKPFIQMCQAALYPTCFYEHVTDDMLYFPGNIELFYLHPKRFTPKPVWDLLGIEPNTRFAIVRFVKWDAWHDIQLVGGFTLEQKRTLIARLQQLMRVFISSESELPADLEPYRIQIPIERMHDVQAAAALFVGESATMASESVCLGTPAIYIDEVGRGYTDEEAREGLLWMFRPVPNRKALKECEPSWISGGVEECISCAESLAQSLAQSIATSQLVPLSINSTSINSTKGTSMPPSELAPKTDAAPSLLAPFTFDPTTYAQRHQSWLSTKIDCTGFLTWFIENYPSSATEVKNATPDFWDRFK